MAGRRWTEEEENYLRENCIDMTCEEIGKVIGRTTKSTQHKYGQMGLERPQPNVGEAVGNFIILEKWIEHNGRQNRTMVKCRCKCGHETKQILTSIVNGFVENCEECHQQKLKELGIFQKTHGEAGTPLHRVWAGIVSRCKYDYDCFRNYSGKGLTVCEEWKTYENFRDWALANGWREGLEIDRIDGNKGYSPENCRVVTRKENANNRSDNIRLTVFGETKTAAMWSEDPRCPDIAPGMICWRHHKGWSDEDAVTKPVRVMRNLDGSLYKPKNKAPD